MSNNIANICYESELIGRCLQSNDTAAVVVQELVISDFFEEVHRIIFNAIKKIYLKEESININTVADVLDSEISKIGGINYLTELSFLSESYSIEYLIKAIKEKTLLREAVDFGVSIQKDALICSDITKFISKYQANFNSLFIDNEKRKTVNIKDFLSNNSPYKEVTENNQAYLSGKEIFRGHPTGYIDIDKNIMGLSSGHLIVIGARPGHGKTTLMLNLIRNMQKLKILTFSLEMTAEELLTKLVLIESKVNYDNFSSGNVTTNEINAIYHYVEKLKKASIYINDIGGLTPFLLKTRAKQIKDNHGLDIIFIDYLQLMKGNDHSYENNQVKIASISRDLKSISKELGVPIVALAQLNRESATRDDGWPKITDLRESGAIEADADHVWLLHSVRDIERETHEFKIIIAKNRFGRLDNVKLFWDLKTGNIENKTH